MKVLEWLESSSKWPDPKRHVLYFLMKLMPLEVPGLNYLYSKVNKNFSRFDDGAGGDNEVQRTMLEIVNQLDGFESRGNVKVLMATNRPDTLDPALMRPGRLDRKVEFGLPDLEGRAHIFKIHARTMSMDKDIR